MADHDVICEVVVSFDFDFVNLTNRSPITPDVTHISAKLKIPVLISPKPTLRKSVTCRS